MKKSNLKIRKYLFVVVTLLLLIFLNSSILNNKIQNTIFYISYLPANTINGLSEYFSNTFKIVFSLGDILKENENLRKENNKLLGYIADYNSLKKENENLRKELSLNKREKFNFIDAKIVSFDPNNFSKIIIINKGFSDGISEGDVVVLPGNILLGKVYEVFDDFSKVLFLTDKNNKVSVKFSPDNTDDEIQDRGYSGVLNGFFGKSLFLDLIEKRSIVLKGDMIISSGIDGIYPEGLIVGFVDIVKDSDNAVFKNAYIRPAFLPLDSNFVFVIKK